ncbi:MAG: MCP four helix bundle domain-containing protein, partial [Betaproteobacteria bacterium]|nr:MCP four helix bundle domain-containing protein [Betaproteobacteria bacterium]
MFNNLKVGSRLFFLTAFTSVTTIIVAAFGILGLETMSGKTDSMYNARVMALTGLGKIDGNINALGGEIFRAFQHDPSSMVAQHHISHHVEEHLEKAEKRLEEALKEWAIYTSTSLGEEEKQVISKFGDSFDRFEKEVVRPAIVSLRANDFSNEVVGRFIQGYRQLGLPIESKIRGLIDVNEKLAKQEFDEATRAHGLAFTLMLIWFVVGLLLSILIAWYIIRSIVIPLSSLQTAMGEIEQSGDFTRRVDVSSSDEVGQTAS